MAKKETVELYFDGNPVQCERQDDRNGEHLFVAPNGRFVKFAADVNLDEAVARHNEFNSKKVEKVKDVVYGEVTTFDKDGKVLRVEQPAAPADDEVSDGGEVSQPLEEAEEDTSEKA